MQPGSEDSPGQSAHPRPGMSLLVRAGNLEYDRVLFFSDAIFAIAITLLVLEIPRGDVNQDIMKQLAAAHDHIIGFAISFVVIGMFWMAHHSTFRYITLLDRRVVALNLLFCGLIAFLPYPTALLTEGSRSGPGATIFYAACMTAVGLVETAVWLYASHANRLTPGLTATERQYVAARVFRVPVVFGLSILGRAGLGRRRAVFLAADRGEFCVDRPFLPHPAAHVRPGRGGGAGPVNSSRRR